MRIACLHTAESNISVFETARRAEGLHFVSLRHEVRADLLAAAERAGGLSGEIASQTAAALRELTSGADAVFLTCSTLGPAAADAAMAAAVPVLRVDAALAAESVRRGGLVAVLCTAATTLAPTRALFEEHAGGTGARVDVRFVPGAWEAFKAGRQERYLEMIAEAADAAFRDGAHAVALAQASMAAAARLCRAGRPLSSPEVGLRQATSLAGARQGPRLTP